MPSPAPKPLPSWFPPASDSPSVRRARIAAVALLILGVAGIALGCIMPGATTELLVGAVLVALAVRALFIRQDT